MKSQKEKITRSFTGKTENFEDKKERSFYQRMLRAYLKGHTNFNFGFNKDMFGKLYPISHKVEFEIKKINASL